MCISTTLQELSGTVKRQPFPEERIKNHERKSPSNASPGTSGEGGTTRVSVVFRKLNERDTQVPVYPNWRFGIHSWLEPSFGAPFT